jgi:hypothetical protein
VSGPTLSRAGAAHHPGAHLDHLAGVEGAFSAGDALHDHTRRRV